MTNDQDQLTVYWVKGCGNCTRLKGYLTDREIGYESIDIMQHPEALIEVEKVGIHTMPVLRRGDRWVTGFDLRQVDELLGLNPDPAGRMIDVDELVERTARVLELAGAAAMLLPPEHHDDPTPTAAEGPVKPHVFMRDGQPYWPLDSTKGLVRHLAGHGEKFKRLAMAADGVHEVGYTVTIDGEAAAFGEPVDATPLYRVVDQMELTARDLRAWLLTRPACDFSRTMDTHYGVQTYHELMQSATCAIVQHTRQLVDICEGLGIDAEGPNKLDLEGLLMPAGVWE